MRLAGRASVASAGNRTPPRCGGCRRRLPQRTGDHQPARPGRSVAARRPDRQRCAASGVDDDGTLIEAVQFIWRRCRHHRRHRPPAQARWSSTPPAAPVATRPACRSATAPCRSTPTSAA
jgi:hypothetical protein